MRLPPVVTVRHTDDYFTFTLHLQTVVVMVSVFIPVPAYSVLSGWYKSSMGDNFCLVHLFIWSANFGSFENVLGARLTTEIARHAGMKAK